MAGSAQSQEHLGVGGPELGGGAARFRMKTRLGGRGVSCGALTPAACGGRPARTRCGAPPAAVNPLACPAARPRPVPVHRLRCRGWGSSARSWARVCSRLALQTESEPPSRAQAGDLLHPLAFAGFGTPRSSRWSSTRASDLPSDDTLGKPDGARETRLNWRGRGGETPGCVADRRLTLSCECDVAVKRANAIVGCTRRRISSGDREVFVRGPGETHLEQWVRCWAPMCKEDEFKLGRAEKGH
ncbi:unnamed protein product [Lepidochelys kempii]